MRAGSATGTATGVARSLCIGLLMLLTSCGEDKASSLAADQMEQSATPQLAKPINLDKFGFAAILCGHDDPFDENDKTDYSEEVAGFSNANQLCVTGDERVDANRLAVAAAKFDPVFYIEPVFFDFSGSEPGVQTGRDTLWAGVKRSIADSGIDPKRIIFYLVDEPTLRKLPLSAVSNAANLIKADYPDSDIMMIEAFSEAINPVVSPEIDIWGFNAYTVRDPAKEPRYGAFLDKAAAQLREGQSLVVIADGIHTPFHAAAGLSENDMAEVADNYLKFAQARSDVSMLLVYSWAGGIDNMQEKGVRDIPEIVRDRWMQIGRTILNR